MTPEQDAEMLFQTFLPWINGSTTEEIKYLTKQCAIAAARQLKKQYLTMTTVKGPAKPTHWDYVKQEIEKL